MTVQNQSSRVDYVSTGDGKVFPVPFRFLAPEHLHVYVGEEETELFYGPGFYLDGGSVVLMAGVGAGVKVSIRRVTPLEQPLDLRTQGDFTPEVHEDAFDRAVLIAQELRDGSIDASTIITGEVAGARNVGNTGIGVYSVLVGKVLEFRKIAAANSKIKVTHEPNYNTIRVGLGDVGPADVGAAPATHVGSRDGHPLASPLAAGLMPAEAAAKLLGIAEGANHYIHPGSHPATMIEEDPDHRFASDAQILEWEEAAYHADQTGNPHGLTLEDIGAASKAAFDGHQAAANPHAITPGLIGAATTQALAAVQTALDVHKGNATNPHGVTAAQVGAATAAELSALAALLDAHKGAATNPHAVTAGQVGAPTLTDHAALAGRVSALEGRPLGGTYRYSPATGDWTSPNARGVGNTATQVDAGVFEIAIHPGLFNTPYQYLATVTVLNVQDKLPVTAHLVKYPDLVRVYCFEALEGQPYDKADFELVLHPL